MLIIQRIIPTILLLLGFTLAQAPIGPEFLQNDRLRLEGDSIRFCVVNDVAVADYNRDLAAELAATLLLDAVIIDVTPVRPSEPLDYRLTLNEAQIFYLLSNDCEVFMGLPLTRSSNWDWLLTSRPYHTSRTVFITTNPEYGKLADIPRDQPLGTRILTSGDIRLITYLQTLPANQQWTRHPFYNNLVALEQLLEGNVAASLVWEPAAARYQAAHPQGPELHAISPEPVTLPVMDLGLAFRSRDSFLQVALDIAIIELAEAGILQELSERHNLPGLPLDTRPR
jgi:ABC-type amino acid transport substrate-binding protein